MANSTWPEFQVDHRTDFERPRLLRRPFPSLTRDLGGLSDWAYLMDETRMFRHRLLLRAAEEINRQRADGESMRCGDCGVFTPRWMLDSVAPDDRHELRAHRDGVEVLRCPGCWAARKQGLSSRLELGSVRVERWA